jgi:hypothetical protein
LRDRHRQPDIVNQSRGWAKTRLGTEARFLTLR